MSWSAKLSRRGQSSSWHAPTAARHATALVRQSPFPDFASGCRDVRREQLIARLLSTTSPSAAAQAKGRWGPATIAGVLGAEEIAMAREISREQVRLLIDEDAQLVEVLPAREYSEDHLPGAINLPLRRIETEAKRLLDPNRPVVVYCADSG